MIKRDRREKKDKRERRRKGTIGEVLRKRVCKFCVNKATSIDFKDTSRLERFITERGKIIPKRISGTCAKHQRQLASAIKKARDIALLPFTKK